MVQNRHHRNFSRLNESRVSYFSDLITAAREDTLSLQFQYNIASDDATTTTLNGGTVTQNNSMAVVSSGTNTNGEAVLTSVRGLRYLPGHEGYNNFTASFTGTGKQTGVAGANQYAGCFNTNNGFFIGFNGETFVVGRRRAGTDYITPQSEFNGDPLDGGPESYLEPDLRKLNVFRIRFGWLGASVISFEILRDDGKWYEFHRINYPGTEARPSINNPVLPYKMYVSKSSGDTDVILKTGSISAGTVGKIRGSNRRYKSFSNTKSIGSGDGLVSVFTLRVKETYFGKNNLIHMIPLFVSALTANKTKVRIVKNATLGGTPSYSDVDLENSVVEVDTAGTTVTGGTEVLSPALGGEKHINIKLRDLFIEIYAGETLTFAADTGASGDVTMSARWMENF